MRLGLIAKITIKNSKSSNHPLVEKANQMKTNFELGGRKMPKHKSKPKPTRPR